MSAINSAGKSFPARLETSSAERKCVVLDVTVKFRSDRRGKKHSPEQIVRKFQEAEAMLAVGKTLGQVCQALEVSEQTFHRWRNQYGGMKAQEAKRLRELEEENRRLKKLLAEAELDKAILKEALRGN
jgi:transposase-like protein